MNTTSDLGASLASYQLRTYRFLAFVITSVMMLAISVLAIWLKADAALVVSLMTPLSTLGLGYVVAGAWHDKTIRTAIVKEEAAQHRASQDLPRLGHDDR